VVEAVEAVGVVKGMAMEMAMEMAEVVNLIVKLLVKVRGVVTTMEEVNVQSQAPKTATSTRLKKATVMTKNLVVVEEKVVVVKAVKAVVAVVAVKTKEAKEGTVEEEV